MSNQWSTINGRTSKRGLFVGGIWHCDCQPRLPAEKFQVKDASKKNFGRWFYTCQKLQLKRCPFFLWADDAKVREEAAVLGNSRDEPSAQKQPPSPPTHDVSVSMKAPEAPRTPMRQMKIKSTYQVNKSEFASAITPPKRTVDTRNVQNHDESYDWSSSADEELVEVAESVTKSRSFEQAQSSRKFDKAVEITSPSKRKHSDMSQCIVLGDSDDELEGKCRQDTDDVFLTPSTSTKSQHNSFDVPAPLPRTPVNVRRQLFSESEPQPRDSRAKDADTDAAASPLTLEVLSILSPIHSSLSPNIKNDLVSLLNCQDLRMQGVTRGREIARLAIKAKEGKIVELQQRVSTLEAEKKTSRVVIQHLKTDIANSPKKPRRSRGEEIKRSAV